MKVQTKKCLVCHEGGEVEVNEGDWAKYQAGAFIQNALKISAGLREQIMTGMHPACWDATMGEDDELSYFEQYNTHQEM